jgi:hypothetical protein
MIPKRPFARTVLLVLLLLGAAQSRGQRMHCSDIPGGAAPRGFVENRGQAAGTDGRALPDIRYLASLRGVTLGFRRDGITAVWARNLRREASEANGSRTSRTQLYRMDMTLEGCNSAAELTAAEPEAGVSNFYLPQCAGGALGARSYRRLICREVYPRIDLVYEAGKDGIKYSFLVHPGGRPGDIRMRYDGAEGVTVRGDGGLRISVPGGGIDEQAPVSWLADGSPVAVRARVQDHSVRFDVPACDATQDLVIDPWATYYGGEVSETVTSAVCDGSGNVLFSGTTRSYLFPVHLGAQMQYGGGQDAFLVKLDIGGARAWATFYGGSSEEATVAAAADPYGNIVLAGSTMSVDLPLANPYQVSLQGAGDGFLARFASNGTRVWSTYLGGTGMDAFHDVALDGYGNVFLAGSSGSADFPLASGGFQSGNAGSTDALLCSMNLLGVLRWATYYGGTGNDLLVSVAVDGNGDVNALGRTASSNLPVSAHAFQTAKAGSTDAFVLKVSGAGSFAWATYFGGSAAEEVLGASLDADAHGNVYWTGRTLSTDFPVSAGALQTSKAAGWDAFVVKLDSAGGRAWATYYGGSADDYGYALGLDGNGGLVVCGSTQGGNFPIVNAWQNSFGGDADAWIARFNGSGYASWCTYYGGAEQEIAYCAAVDAGGAIAVGGSTQSTFPLLRPMQSTFAGFPLDGFLMVMNATGDMLPVELSAFSASLLGEAVTLRWRTESERNNAGFAVERADGDETADTKWERRGFTAGRGAQGIPGAHGMPGA